MSVMAHTDCLWQNMRRVGQSRHSEHQRSGSWNRIAGSAAPRKCQQPCQTMPGIRRSKKGRTFCEV